jgi:8-amino-3,8-dideoxy-alpha-D-manno-octulosonate transaminase
LNAAVGLAQLRKLETMVERQRANKEVLKRAIGRFPMVSFRPIPDEAGDSATFLTFFLPDEGRAREAAAALGREGVDGAFYWYDNNWHYLRMWDHLRGLKAPARLPLQLLPSIPDYGRVSVEKSDRIMGRAISLQIKISWTEKEMAQRIEKMEKVLSELC